MQAPSSPSTPTAQEARPAEEQDNLLQELRSIVSSGDYGETTYLLHEVYKRLGRSMDRYITGGFSWSLSVESQASALVFRDACDDVAGFGGLAKLPKDATHLRSLLETSSILKFIKDGVQEEWEAGRECPPDQVAVHLPGYYSKLKFPQAYAFPADNCLQAGNRESPIHVDHARVVSYIPPCARKCFKIWGFFPVNLKPSFKWGNKVDPSNRMLKTTGSAVVVQRPGDVVYLNSLVYHSVLLGFLPETPPSKRWGGIFGDVILLVQDREQSFKYATQLASGSERGSDRAWRALLSAFCVIEGRVWNDENYEEEKKIFMEKLPKTKEKQPRLNFELTRSGTRSALRTRRCALCGRRRKLNPTA